MITIQFDKVGPSIALLHISSSMGRKLTFYSSFFQGMALKLDVPVTDALLQLHIKFECLEIKYSKVAKVCM